MGTLIELKECFERENMTRGKQTIRKMINKRGIVVYEKQDIVTIIQNFYMKNRKASSEDRIKAGMLKEGGATLEKAILILLNKCMDKGRIPEACRKVEVKNIFKNRDCSSIEKYRLIYNL